MQVVVAAAGLAPGRIDQLIGGRNEGFERAGADDVGGGDVDQD
jgi:hypothetical protein